MMLCWCPQGDRVHRDEGRQAPGDEPQALSVPRDAVYCSCELRNCLAGACRNGQTPSWQYCGFPPKPPEAAARPSSKQDSSLQHAACSQTFMACLLAGCCAILRCPAQALSPLSCTLLFLPAHTDRVPRPPQVLCDRHQGLLPRPAAQPCMPQPDHQQPVIPGHVPGPPVHCRLRCQGWVPDEPRMHACCTCCWQQIGLHALC